MNFERGAAGDYETGGSLGKLHRVSPLRGALDCQDALWTEVDEITAREFEDRHRSRLGGDGFPAQVGVAAVLDLEVDAVPVDGGFAAGVEDSR